MGNRIYNGPAKMSMHFLAEMCNVVNTRLGQYFGRYLVNFVVVYIYYNPSGRFGRSQAVSKDLKANQLSFKRRQEWMSSGVSICKENLIFSCSTFLPN